MAGTYEQLQQTEPDFSAWEAQFADPAERLKSIPSEGFTPEQHAQVIDQISSVGLPVDNYTKLVRRPNESGTENVLGSWGTGSDNYGEFSVYELLDKQVPEKRLGTIAHESAHANSPLRPENAHLFGGEPERVEAETFAKNLATQSLITGKYLTGYQKHLAKQLFEGQIGFDTFTEESQAIATELALTNRSKLEQVEVAQHAKLAKLQKGGLLAEDVQPVSLMSHAKQNGEVAVDGVDKQLIALIGDVDDHQGLIDHVDGLKAKFYPQASLDVATERSKPQSPPDVKNYMSRLAVRQALEVE